MHTLLSRLSPREREVLALLGRGWSNIQIGRELFISAHTVRTHIQNILAKLRTRSEREAVARLLARRKALHPKDWPPEALARRYPSGSRLNSSSSL
jgi:two-component system response regulator DevR